VDKREKQESLEQYKKEKEKGVPFFPDAVFKDAIAALVVFLLLAGLAFVLGVPLEAPADPADNTYNPRPDWYFLFLFQLLKYFPGQLEVVGVFVIPTLLILLLFALPFLDRKRERYFTKRPVVIGATAFLAVGVVFLTVLAVVELPPPAQVAPGDQTAALYTENCAACHGASVVVPAGTNLHEVIAQGSHDGMPAWSGDLTSDEIDALAGFVLSPAGSLLFVQNCGDCHDAPDLVAGNPLELKNALELGLEFAPHEDQAISNWSEILSPESRTALLNFLVAPDGQRLFSTNCASCHGRSVAVTGDEAEMRALISQGGLHLEMPPWRERLSDSELDILANYVVDPGSAPEAEELFAQNCIACHGQRVPASSDIATARETIATGGAHETMPVWGEVLTDEQLDALVAYTIQAARGTSLEVGQQLFSENCTPCHGDFGEGGPNPTRLDDIIAPISSAEYLRTRDDSTLRAIIAQGQPNFGMSPFGTAFGGPLDDEDVNSIVAFIRAWEANPPVEFPPEVASRTIAVDGARIYADVCAQCHGPDGGGLIGHSLRDSEFQAPNTDQDIFDTINLGHRATSMIGWGEILSSDQISQIVIFIRELARSTEVSPSETEALPSFSRDVLSILEAGCLACHGSLGGWDASSYEAVMTTGDNAPVVIPGDPEGSLLGQKLLGTQEQGTVMPPAGALSSTQVQIILNWIAAGALDD
jgi:mono/diheme cytochrome c family protein